ncbi:MAG TPA: hypothetical protein VIP11_18230 [Gemmatimonadaceae bacterium]
MAALLLYLFERRYAIRSGNPSSVDLLAVATVLALSLSAAFKEVTLGGVSFKRFVRREVIRAESEARRLLATVDLAMMPIWEREHSSVPSDWSAQKVELLARTVRDLEDKFRKASPKDRAAYAIALRDVYWQWLAAARHHWASSAPYHDVWRHVEKGFAEIGGLKHEPTR